MAAAVADFRTTAPAKAKLRRVDGPPTLKFQPAPDILKTIRKKFKGTVVAFSLQAGNDRETARSKLQDKGADFIVVNPYDEAGAGFDAETNHVWLVTAAGDEEEIPLDTKPAVARRILELVARRTG